MFYLSSFFRSTPRQHFYLSSVVPVKLFSFNVKILGGAFVEQFPQPGNKLYFLS